MKKHEWFLISTETEYKKAADQYETLKGSVRNSPEHKERLLLAFLMNAYDQKNWSMHDLDPITLIKIRMDEFGYKPKDLQAVYGDKGTISKVLNYKQPLSLTMIRRFSKLLRIPAAELIKEYATRP